jgi:AcrR family transcriptional regulator
MQPPQRKDAERNRRRLLDAGREVFAEKGLAATLNDVAHHAGVGVGTAYRHFPNKEALASAILERQVDELEQILRGALAEADPWIGLVRYLEQSLAMQVEDRGMAQIMSGHRVTRERFDWERDRLAPLINAVAERARDAGMIRPDVTGTDLVIVQIGLIAIARTAREGAGNVQRQDLGRLYLRYLGLFLDGIRIESSVLPVPPLSTEESHAMLTGIRSPPT